MTPDDDRDRYDVIASRIFFAVILGLLVGWLVWPLFSPLWGHD